MQGLLAFQRYFDFSGRSARAEYWQFFGLVIITGCVALLFDLAIGGPDSLPVLTLIVFLVSITPMYAVAVRRLHDRDRTGWWIGAQAAVAVLNTAMIAAFAKAKYTPLGDLLQPVGRVIAIGNLLLSLFLLYQMVRRGDGHANQYGPDPLTHATPAPTLADLTDRVQAAAASAGINKPPSSRLAINDDPLAQIERLAKLRDAGMLTEEEFAQQKAAYLSRL